MPDKTEQAREIEQLRAELAAAREERNRLYRICIEAMNTTDAQVVDGVSVDLLEALPGEIRGTLRDRAEKAKRETINRIAEGSYWTYTGKRWAVLRGEPTDGNHPLHQIEYYATMQAEILGARVQEVEVTIRPICGWPTIPVALIELKDGE